MGVPCGTKFLRIGHFFLFRGNRNGLLVALFIPGGAPHNDLYGETPGERGTFFFLFRGNRGALFRGNRNGLLVALFIPGGAPHNDLYGETPGERGTFFFLFRGN